jgi:hypothetical protein
MLIAIGLVAVSAAPADAAKLRTVSQSQLAGANGSTARVTAVARCPEGTKAVSGGFTITPPSPGTPATVHSPGAPGHLFVVNESIMTPRGDGWRVSGAEHVQGSLDGFTAYAYCEKRKRAVRVGGTVRTDSIPTEAGLSTGNTARCPKGTTAMSGGFSTTSLGAYFNRSRGAGRDWSVGVTTFAAGSSTDLYDVEAYCVRGKVRTTKAEGITPGSFGPVAGVGAAMTPGCAKGGFVRGGGYGSPPPGANLNGALVIGDVLGSKGWSVTFASLSVAQGPFTAFGYCRAG